MRVVTGGDPNGAADSDDDGDGTASTTTTTSTHAMSRPSAPSAPSSLEPDEPCQIKPSSRKSLLLHHHRDHPDRFQPTLAVQSLTRLAMTSTAADATPLPSSSSSSSIPQAGPFSTSRQLFSQHLARLVVRLDSDPPTDPDALKATVAEVVHQSFAPPTPPSPSSQQPWQRDAQRVIIERALDDVVQESAVFPATKAQHAQLESALDLLLAFVEAGFADENLPLTTLASLIELRPISACEPLLGYIESRVERLTAGMEYQRGRGPILLRLLNDLLRRLPRSKSTPVILSGRILMLLSSVYPLGEKSGVNLRGNFNTQKGTVWEQDETVDDEAKPEKAGSESKADNEREPTPGDKDDAEGKSGTNGQSKRDKDKMEVEEGEEAEQGGKPKASSPSFYSTFWSLQRYFNNPHLLFASDPASPTLSPLTTLHSSLLTVLSTFAAETRKEKELTGSGSSEPAAAAKGKARVETATAVEAMMTGEKDELDKTEESLEQYFFPKFLTSRNLLSLELSDPTFRLQLLVQTLILTQYLLSLTPANRARAQSLPLTNTSAFPAFVLSPTFEPLVEEIERKAYAEISNMSSASTSSSVRRTIERVLERERNWTDWKLRSCLPFTKPPLSSASSSSTGSVSEIAQGKLRNMTRPPPRFPHKLGNARLSRVWTKDLKTLDGFEPDVTDDEFDSIVREWRMTKKRLGMVQSQLDQAAGLVPRAKRSELEASIEPLTIKLQALQFRALRSASTTYLRHFSKIGSGDVDKLLDEIDKERRAKEDAEEEEARRVEEALLGPKGTGSHGDGSGEGGREGDASKRDEEDDAEDKKAAIRLGDTPVRDEAIEEEKEDAKEEVTVNNAPGPDEESGTPPPPPSRVASASASTATPPKEPGTPKRPRDEPTGDEPIEGDADMQDVPTTSKKQKI
ncbi:hypothetical protein JCM11491_000665 [Sporobolomyces phaffii]